MKEAARLAKMYLADEGIKVYQKDMVMAEVHKMNGVDHHIAHGLIDHFYHREIYIVEMKDGTRYEILRETVDKDGNFSTDSARFVTREVRKFLEDAHKMK